MTAKFRSAYYPKKTTLISLWYGTIPCRGECLWYGMGLWFVVLLYLAVSWQGGHEAYTHYYYVSQPHMYSIHGKYMRLRAKRKKARRKIHRNSSKRFGSNTLLLWQVCSSLTRFMVPYRFLSYHSHTVHRHVYFQSPHWGFVLLQKENAAEIASDG